MRICDHDMIIGPIISEKASAGIPNHCYTFKVMRSANKVQIKKAIKNVFSVNVEKVNTLNVRGVKKKRGNKIGFTPAWKKAIVTLKKGEKGIEFFDTML